MRVLPTGVISIALVMAVTGCSATGSATVEPPSSDTAATARGSATPDASLATPPEGASPSPVTTVSPIATLTATHTIAIPSGWPSPGAYPPEGQPGWDMVHTSWPFLPSFEELIETADVFVVGEVVAVRPGESISGKIAKSDSLILVSSSAKGGLPAGSVVVVQQTGGVEDHTESNRDRAGSPAPLPPEAPPGAQPLPPGPTLPPFMLWEQENDPIFRAGERVALALQWSPYIDMYQVWVGPQGRFQIDDQDRVHPMLLADPAVASLDGLTIEELLARVEAIATD